MCVYYGLIVIFGNAVHWTACSTTPAGESFVEVELLQTDVQRMSVLTSKSQSASDHGNIAANQNWQVMNTVSLPSLVFVGSGLVLVSVLLLLAYSRASGELNKPMNNTDAVDQVSSKALKRVSIEDIIEDTRGHTFFQQYYFDARNLEEIEIMKFVVARLSIHTEKIGDATGVHHNLQRVYKMIRELDVIRGLSFNVVEAFEAEVLKVECLQPFPTMEDMQSCMDDLNTYTYQAVPGTETILGQYKYLLENARTGQNIPQEEEEVYKAIKQNEHAALKIAVDELNKINRKYKRFPILNWFTETLLFCVRDPDSEFGVCARQWAMLHPAEEDTLCWAQLGDIVKRAVHVGCMTDAQCMRMSFHELDSLQVDVLPSFLLQLTRYTALLERHVKQTANLRAKLLAGFVTIGITFGQYLVKKIDFSMPS